MKFAWPSRRINGALAMNLAAALSIFGCSSASSNLGRADAGVDHTLSGKVSLPRSGDVPSRVVVQLGNGVVVGAATTTSEGLFSIPINVPNGARLFVMAVLASDPEERVYAVADVVDGKDDPITLDTRSSATAIILAATGRMDHVVSEVMAAYGYQIESIRSSISTGSLLLCSAEASTTTGAAALFDPIREVAATASPTDSNAPEFLRKIVQRAGEAGDPLVRLQDIQRLVSENVAGLDYAKFDTAPGNVRLALARMTLAALTHEGGADITDQTVTQPDLGIASAVIAGAATGGCREKTYLAAYGAALMNEVKQVAIVGGTLKGGNTFAAAVACLDGAEVVKVTDLAFAGGAVTPASVTAGRCFVVAPWAPGNPDPKAGLVKVFDGSYAASANWDQVLAVKPVTLDRVGGKFSASGRVAKGCDCSRGAAPSECAPFVLPQAGAGTPTRDAGAARD